MMAHCITRGFVLQYDTKYDVNLPVCENWDYEIYKWLGQYIEKMKTDLIAIGAWDTCGSRSNLFSQWP